MTPDNDFIMLIMADICVLSLFIICCCSCWIWCFLFDCKGVWRSGLITGSVSLIGEMLVKPYSSLQANGWESMWVFGSDWLSLLSVLSRDVISFKVLR